MRYKGIIFDFNGTLFWDTDLHNEAWINFASNHGQKLTDEELKTKLHGKVNKDILEYLFNKKMEDGLVQDYANEKEHLYRELAIKNKHLLELAPGAIDFINELNKNNIPIAIATSSDKSNVDFYHKIFNLNQWFPDEKIIYHDGKMEGKPAPDIFIRALKRLNMEPGDCIVIEDTINGIKAAQNAKIGKIILIQSGNHVGVSDFEEIQIIKDFKGMDVNVLKK